MATFSGLFSANDIWLLQKFTQCHLATEETLADRVSFGDGEMWMTGDWWVDGGNIRCAWGKSGGWLRANYKSGRLHGIRTGENGSRQRWVDRWKEGKRHGLDIMWHVSGQMMWRENWKDGRRHGVGESWYETGQRARCEKYKNGCIHGVYTVWYESGQMRLRTPYKNGYEHGLSEYWFESGQLRFHAHYQDGCVIGSEECWCESKVHETRRDVGNRGSQK